MLFRSFPYILSRASDGALQGGREDAEWRAEFGAEKTGQGTQILPLGGQGEEAYTGIAAGGAAGAGNSSGGDFEGTEREALWAFPAGAERAAGNDFDEGAGPGGAGDGLQAGVRDRAARGQDDGGTDGATVVGEDAGSQVGRQRVSNRRDGGMWSPIHFTKNVKWMGTEL